MRKVENKLKFIFLRQEHHHVRRIGLNIKFTIFFSVFCFMFFLHPLSHFMHFTMGKVQIHTAKECCVFNPFVIFILQINPSFKTFVKISWLTGVALWLKGGSGASSLLKVMQLDGFHCWIGKWPWTFLVVCPCFASQLD